MAWSFNQATVMGNLTRDPELRATPSGLAVCNFCVATNRRVKDQTTDEWRDMPSFVDVVAWGSLGERVSQYCQKGKPVLVNGRLQSSSWEQDGQKRSKLEIIASDVIFLGTGTADQQASSSSNEAPTADDSKAQVTGKASSKKATKQDPVADNIPEGEIDLDDIPF